MKRVAIALCLALLPAIPAIAAGPPDAGGEKKPHLTFKQDGADLIVSTQVPINNSPHALGTAVQDLGDRIVLRYSVVQNTDLLVRSLKWITVTWRLSNHRQGEKQYEVSGQTMTLTTAELKGLQGGWPGLVDAGEKWLKQTGRLNKD